MFKTQSKSGLAKVLNQFHVPMFAVQRPSSSDPFHVVCINDTLGEITGLDPVSVADAALTDILPQADAASVLQHYETCARTQSDVRYTETLKMPNGTLHWDTSLQYVALEGGGDRLVGLSVTIARDAAYRFEDPVVDDIRFFSALADLQLSNLLGMLENAQADRLFRDDSADRTNRLSALCRGAHRAVGDIRRGVASPPNRTDGARNDRVGPLGDGSKGIGARTLRTLHDAAWDPTSG